MHLLTLFHLRDELGGAFLVFLGDATLEGGREGYSEGGEEGGGGGREEGCIF